jgi:hypothetical protein
MLLSWLVALFLCVNFNSRVCLKPGVAWLNVFGFSLCSSKPRSGEIVFMYCSLSSLLFTSE